MKDIRTTNILLLIIVVPIIFYVLQILSFIFIPLILAMFIALLFLPFMRWLSKKRVPKWLSVFIVLLIMIGAIKIGGELIKLSSKEILSSDVAFFEKAESKLVNLVLTIEDFFGIERLEEDNLLKYYFQKTNLINNFGPTIGFIQKTISMTLMTAFFVVLLLAGSINFQKLLNGMLFKQKFSSVKTFMKIEKDIIKFIKVKFVISLFTGIGFGVACLLFDVSFPIFWGLFAFSINFIQMIGSVISVLALSLFGFVELDPTGTLLFFIIVITGVQVLMGGILEPIFMGKSFSINVITILVMLMFWGFIWGVPGLIMSIPITVFVKIILDQFPKTKVIAEFLSGSGQSVNNSWKAKK
jgi:predicted PurR-regulated permease PerM